MRTSDLVKKYLEKEFGYKAEKAAIDNISLNLENMNIFFWGNNDPLATYLKQYSGFFSYKNKEIRECTELFLGDTLREECKGKYDLIIMQRLLSYVEKPDEILDLLYSLLKVGGCLLLNLPIFEQKKTYIRQNKDKKYAVIYDISIEPSYNRIDDEDIRTFEKMVCAKERIRLEEIALNAINNADAILKIENTMGE